METVKLTSAEKEILQNINQFYGQITTLIRGLMQENLNYKLGKMAEEHGLNVDEEKWQFDPVNQAFKKLEEPKPAIPSKKRGRKPKMMNPVEPKAEPSGEPNR